MTATATTEDALLNGRVRLRQFRDGLRAGLDAVLLAAFVPAEPGERVLEAGCGTGAAFLCLAARVPDLVVTGLEREAALAKLARENALANSVQADVLEGDVADIALARRMEPFDHAFANPPYWSGGTAPPQALRRTATHEAGAGLECWVRFLTAAVRPGGSVSLVLPAARFDAGVAALRGAGCGAIQLLPVVPHAGKVAKRCLLRGRKGGRGPAAILPALALHEKDGASTRAAEDVLREAGALHAP